MTIPAADKILGQSGHTTDHNLITDTLAKHTATDLFDVVGYGAVGDDTTDDTDALSDAITAANVAGGVVWFGGAERVYKISDSLTTITSGVTLAGNGATIHQTGINPALTSTVPNPGTAVYSAVRIAATASNVVIDGVRFLGDSSSFVNLHWATAVEFLYTTGPTVSASDCTVMNCRFENLYGFGVHYTVGDAGNNINVLDSSFDTTGQAINVNADYCTIRGNYLTNAESIEASGRNITVSDNVINTTPYGGPGISLGGNTGGSQYPGATCTGNTILYAGSHGISVAAGSADCVIANNSIVNATRIGIFVGNGGSGAAPERVTLANNVITSCGLDTESDGNQQGIYVTGVTDVTVIGNKIGNNATAGYTSIFGIQLYQCSGAVVIGNSAEGVTNKSLSCNATTDITVGHNRWLPANEEFVSGSTLSSTNYYFYGASPILKLGDGVNGTVDAELHIQADATQRTKLSFNQVTTPKWEIFRIGGDGNLYFRDVVNSTNPLQFIPGASPAGVVQINHRLSVQDRVGFNGVTPVARPSAYTQTYATTSKTQSTPTAAALTVTDGTGTNDGTIGAITADASVIAAVQEIAAQIAKLVTDNANTKQVLNSVVDDLQTYGLLQ